jgi:hypothetical protein
MVVPIHVAVMGDSHTYMYKHIRAVNPRACDEAALLSQMHSPRDTTHAHTNIPTYFFFFFYFMML